MSTNPRNRPFPQFCLAMLLGLVMAAAIAVFAEPGLAWLGFAMAGIYRAIPRRRECLAGVRGRGG
jgi:hypothetical protein